MVVGVFKRISRPGAVRERPVCVSVSQKSGGANKLKIVELPAHRQTSQACSALHSVV